jgi:hypothetical protein
MRITIPGFQGQVNVIAPQRLEDSQAVEAKNCLIQSGDLAPFKTAAFAANSGISPSGNDTIYRHPTRWLAWNGRVSVVRAPNASDTKHRIYFSDGTNFRVTDDDLIGAGSGAPAASRKVGLPAPTLPGYTFTQAGQGLVASVTLYTLNSSADSALPLVNCTAAHGLKTNDTVLLNLPGFASKGAFTVVITSDIQDQPTMFRIRGYTRKKANWSSVKKPKDDVNNGGAQMLSVQANGHPFSDGDIVLVHTDATNMRGTQLTPDSPYMVAYQDTNRFQLVGTDSWSSTAIHSLTGTKHQQAVILQEASDPMYGPATVTTPENTFTNLPNFIWDAGSAQYVITAYPNGSQNGWIKTDVAANLRDRAYVATFVNGYGEEGPPSSPTDIRAMTQGTACTFAATPSTNLNGPTNYNLTAIRYYRTDANGLFRLTTMTLADGSKTTDVPYGSVNVVDTTYDALLGESLPTLGWYEPPANLQGIILMPGGVIVGFVDKSIYASVPYIASAYPYEYQLKVDYPIVGLVNTAAGVVVLTQGLPSLIVGTDPSTWSLVKLEAAQACVSAKSIVDMGDYAVYASPFGLVAIAQNDAQVVTGSVFSRLQWQEYTPSAIKASFYEGKYFGSSDSKTFVFNPSTKDFVQVDQVFSAFYNDLSTDTLYVLQSDGSIAAWDRGAGYLTYSLTSKLFQAPYPTSMGAAQVISEATSANPVTFMLYADGTLRHTQTVVNNEPFRLPSGFRALNFQIKLTGSVKIKTCVVAGSVTELREA